ncbi:MAG: hypothetical protein Q8L36_00160 [bacterium]|nr:hypothetical protein [bacterium]
MEVDVSKLPEWQRDILNRASDPQRRRVIGFLERGWTIIEGRFGGNIKINCGFSYEQVKTDGLTE